MTAIQIIKEIDRLPPEEFGEVVRHTSELVKIRQLSPKELGAMVDRFADATDPAEVERLREQITEGFYGHR